MMCSSTARAHLIQSQSILVALIQAGVHSLLSRMCEDEDACDMVEACSERSGGSTMSQYGVVCLSLLLSITPYLVPFYSILCYKTVHVAIDCSPLSSCVETWNAGWRREYGVIYKECYVLYTG